MQIEIKKPIYSDYIYIRKETLELAARLGELLEVKIPQGSRAIDPKEWMAKGKIMKKIFKQPGIDSFPLDLTINFPKKLRLLNSSIHLVKGDNKISSQVDITHDQTFNFNFSPK
mgnify:CR=1 FL=1